MARTGEGIVEALPRMEFVGALGLRLKPEALSTGVWAGKLSCPFSCG